MRTIKLSRKEDLCSCNFCKRGVLSKDHVGLVYPYDVVYSFSSDGSGISAIICNNCFDELVKKINEIRTND